VTVADGLSEKVVADFSIGALGVGEEADGKWVLEDFLNFVRFDLFRVEGDVCEVEIHGVVLR